MDDRGSREVEGVGRKEQERVDLERFRVGGKQKRIREEAPRPLPAQDGVSRGRITLYAVDGSISLNSATQWSLDCRTDYIAPSTHRGDYYIGGERTWNLTAEGRGSVELFSDVAQQDGVRTPVTIDLGEHGRFEGELTSLAPKDGRIELRALGRLREQHGID